MDTAIRFGDRNCIFFPHRLHLNDASLNARHRGSIPDGKRDTRRRGGRQRRWQVPLP